jgi:nitronate monooxygenase
MIARAHARAGQALSMVALLNTLLEAERAGAKVLATYLADYKEGSPDWRTLKAIQRDESRNCAVLMRLLRHIEGPVSAATGAFLGKALKINGRSERLRFLNIGQAWVARRIEEALPAIADPHVKSALQEMYASHVENIERCNALLD